jgi:hypothetical protein
VVETALGLRIAPEKFPEWFLGKSTTSPDQAAA